MQALRRTGLWLIPGMGVKRHIMLAVLGSLILIGGALGGILWLAQGDRQALSEPIEQVLISPLWLFYGGWISVLILLSGLALVIGALRNLNRSLLSNWLPKPDDAAVVLHRRLSLSRGPHIVAFGGGSGLSNLLRGLRHYSSNVTAIVGVSDDGGSSGRLRDAFNIPAPGDLVDCLAALSDDELMVSELLEYRFTRGKELSGHTFGNLLITTLTEVKEDFSEAIRALNTLLNICGAVYPVTSQPTHLKVIKRSGEEVHGESYAREVPGAIERVLLEPSHVRVVPDILFAIETADIIVLGPGSLFTSTLPPLLVNEVRGALQRCRAPIVYICNIMTEAGETDHFSSWDHIAALHTHLGRYPDEVVINRSPVDEERLARYREENAEVVHHVQAPFDEHRIATVHLNLLGSGLHAQHDSVKLAAWLNERAKTAQQRQLSKAV